MTNLLQASMSRAWCCLLATALATSLAPAAPADVPIGHADYTPSPQQPIGWMGDGSANYVGAKPPTEWDEASGKNIRWMIEMPMPSNAQPIVVGNRVFALADPDVLMCVDADSGKVLWQRQCLREIFPQLKDKPDADLATIRKAFIDALDANYHIYQGGVLNDEGKQLQVSWRTDWEKWAAPLPSNKILQQRVASLQKKHPVILSAVNKGETNHRTFATDELLKAAGLPMGNESEDFNWYTTTFVPPVSDGKLVYARFLFDTVVAFDLQGNHQWTWNGDTVRRARSNMGISTNPMILHENRLWVPTRSGISILDVATGKQVQSLDKNHPALKGRTWNTGDAGQILTPFTMKGERYFLVTQRHALPWVVRARDAEPINQVKSGVSPTATGAYVVGDVLYGSRMGYGSKGNSGVWACRIEQAADGTFSLKELWYASREDFKVAPQMVNGMKNVKRVEPALTWRGICVAGDRIFACRDSQEVLQFSTADGTILDFCKSELVKCPHTNEPIVAGDYVFVPTWSGFTSVFEAKTGKLLGANKTEPNHGSAITAHGNRLYMRGFYHLYCIGEK